MATDPVYLVQGDNSAQIRVTLTREADGSAVDMTGGSVKLRVRERFATDNSFTLNGTISDAENGIAIFSLAGGEIDDIAEGVYLGEIEFTNGLSQKETVFDLVEFIIREDFG